MSLNDLLLLYEKIAAIFLCPQRCYASLHHIPKGGAEGFPSKAQNHNGW